MIRITIEMLPNGSEDASYVLAQGIIANDGKGTETVGNYFYGLSGQAKRPHHDPGIRYQGEVSGFPRKRLNVWHLLKRVLDDAL